MATQRRGGYMRRSAAMLLLAALLINPAQGASHADDWPDTPRDYTIQDSRQELIITGTSETGTGADRFRLSYTTASDTLRTTYRAHADDPNSTVRMDIRWVALVEFMDQDMDGRYSLGDPIVQRIPLADASNKRVSSSSGTPQQVEIIYPLQGMFGADLRIVFDVPPTGDTVTDPHHVDMRMQVSGFRFQSDNQTMLALETRVTGAEVLSSQSMGADGDGHQVAWLWNDTADAEGQPNGTADVGVTVQDYLASTKETLVVFSLPRSPATAHETAIAVAPLPDQDPLLKLLPPVGDWRIFTAGVVVTIGVMAWTVRRVMGKEA